MIDFHCHLDLYANPATVVKECVARQLYVLSVTTTPSAWNQTAALVAGHERIRTALGLHPELAAQRKHELVLFDRLLPNIKYVGEIGLDGSPQFRNHWADQVFVFEHILTSCRLAGGRIMSIHSRRAVSAVLDRLSREAEAGVAVLHWYSGSSRDLDRAVKLGCWFSVNPSMMFGTKGRELVRRIPPDRILTETDGPFATLNGQCALPWNVDVVVSQLAEVWQVPQIETQTRLENNLRELLRLT